jgi:hypothetical protein
LKLPQDSPGPRVSRHEAFQNLKPFFATATAIGLSKLQVAC